MLLAFALLSVVTSAFAQVGTDFKQWGNVPQRDWINSILQSNNSAYYEGSSTLQRIVLVGIPATNGNTHSLRLSHQAYKSGRHAYDFITSYDQALLDYPGASGGGDLTIGLAVNGTNIGPQATAAMVQALHSGPHSATATVPAAALYSTVASFPPDNVSARVAAYDASVGGSQKRAVQLYGNAPISNATLTLLPYSGNSADRYAEYDLTWTSASDNVLILMGGHLAIGGNGLGVSYGPGKGAGSISGGPYHFKLATIDGISLGSQDNQIMASAIIAPPVCDITGNANICAGQSATFTGPADLDSYSWTITGNGTITSAINAQVVTVQAGASGSFVLTLRTIDDGVPSVDNCTFTVNINSASCNLAPQGPVCPGSTQTFNATPGSSSYSWVVTGNGTLVGPNNGPSAQVQAGPLCNAPYTVQLYIAGSTACTGACTQTVQVIDNVPPVFSNVPGPQTYICPAVFQWPTPTVTDNCGGAVSVTFTTVRVPGICHDTYSRVRTWTATDACGNSTSVSATVNIVDNVAPVFTYLPPSQTISCNSNFTWPMATAKDSCCLSTVTFADDTVAGNCPGNYVVTRTWTATDDCGNARTATTVITVVDDTPPSITAAGANATIQCPAQPQFTPPTASDLCSGATVNAVGQVVTAGPVCARTYTMTWNAVDGCGNVSNSVSQTITVLDNAAPTITAAGPNATIECPGQPQFTPPTATDLCSGATVNAVGQVVTGGTSCARTYTMTWNAVDGCGNVSNPVSQTITVIDTTPPVLTGAGASVSIECPAVPQFTPPTATDLCSGATVRPVGQVQTSGTVCARVYTMTWDAIDGCGNVAGPVSQSITVIDTTDPVLVGVPGNTTIACGQTPTWPTVTGTDNCCSPVVEIEDQTTPGNCPGTYVITRTWTATDLCDNTVTASATITVVDNVAPVITAAGPNAAIECPGQPQFTPPTATDLCSGATVNAVGQVVTGGTSCARTYTMTWNAVDGCGNVSDPVSQTITVIDTTPPVLTAAGANASIQCPAMPQFTPPTASDLCSGATVRPVGEVVTSGPACARVYTMTWDAIDGCGNVAGPVSQSITVIDNVAPVISAAGANATISCPAQPSFTPPTATDACTTAVVNQVGEDVVAGNNCLRTYTRTWNAVDACGNVSGTVSQTITVIDNTAPVISAAGANATVVCPAMPQFTPPTATDVCTTAVVNQVGEDVVTGNNCSRIYTRTWNAVDACGNVSGTVSQSITVIDNVAPVISAAGANATIQCPAQPSFTPPTAIDACTTAVVNQVGQDVIAGSLCNRTVTRTWNAVDACGNVSGTVSQTITIIDTTAPVISAAGANAIIQCPALPVFTPPTATDACTTAVVNQVGQDVIAGTLCNRTVTRTWNAVDACGNVSGTVSQTITIIDNTAPTYATPAGANATIECPALPVFTPPTATDACTTAVVNQVGQDVIVGDNCNRTYTRSWRAVDACGNMAAIVSQTITVVDTTPPQANLGASDTLTFQCNEQIPPAPPVQVTDNCDQTPNVTFQDSVVAMPGCLNGSIIYRSFIISDGCGNTMPQPLVQVIMVIDNVAPVISAACPNATIQCPAQPQFTPPTATDNCGPATVNQVGQDVIAGSLCNRTVTRSWNAIDGCGNVSGTVSQTITIIDTTAPVISAAGANATIQCPAQPQFTPPTATDACTTAVVNQVGQDVVAGSLCNRTVTRTWNAIDACGNVSGTVSQTITIIDTTAPVISAAGANATIQCPAQPSFTPPTATDACTTAVVNQVGQDVVAGSLCNRTVTRTWNAVDACGNVSGTVSQTITIIDTTAPVISAAGANATIQCPAQPSFTPPTATDACTTAVVNQVGQDVIAGTLCNRTVTRTWNAVDACGNVSGTVSQTITIIDTTAPVISAAGANATIQCPAQPSFTPPTATDACTTAVVNQVGEDVIAGTLCNRTVTRSWNAVDACGNVSGTVSQTITIIDTTAPVISAAGANTTIQCPAMPVFTPPTATDACTTAVVQAVGQVVTAGTSCARRYTMTWNAVDACGNVSGSVSQTITVIDTNPPVFSNVPQNQTIQCDQPIVWGTPMAADACNGATITHQDVTTPGNCPQSYTVTRTWKSR